MPADPAAVKALFLEAAAIGDPVARAAFVKERCREDPALLARVNALLVANDLAVANEGTASFGGAVGSDAAEPTADYPGKDEQEGTVIVGKYTLVEVIGEGGMGSVWRAKQTEPVKRFVAVKLIKAGMDSKQVLDRFEAERQALALMDHPNIAKVLDGGLHAHRPFFVMELVKGVPITDYCDARKLTPRERLELFVPVCLAIQHAHQKGIIHRDLKPSNVLVALYDDKPVVKVIDFGVAKATGSALTEHTIDTGFGRVVGTPEYMSPEQASLNNLDIDTRSDVYSLGVLLYELLTGTTPVDRQSLGKVALLEVLRIVREVEAPRPSAKLSTLATLPSVAANRGIAPAKLSRLMKGELDWLVLKALEKDRTRRYGTANGLARDIQRYLADELVEARPPSTGYRLRKFVRRNKGWLRAAAALALVLVIAFSAVWVVKSQADRERATAEADRIGREAGTAASVKEAVREARERAGEAWNLHDYPDRMQLATAAAVAAVARAEGFLAGGAPTEAALVELASARQAVDDLARHTRLINAWAANQRQFAEELNGGYLPRVRLAERHADALRQFGLDLVGGDADEVARAVASSPLRDSLLGMLLEWHFHAEYLSKLPPRPADVSPGIPAADPAVPKRLARVIRSARILCGGAYARWQDLLDRSDDRGLVAFAASPDGLGFRSTLLTGLGRDLAKYNQHSACRTFLRAAVDRYPNDVWLRMDLATACSSHQPPDWPEALRHISAASALWPESGLFHMRIAECSAALGSKEQAEAAFRKGLSLRPGLGEGYRYSLSAAAREKAAEEVRLRADLEGVQGKWERVSATAGMPFGEAARAVKEIRGNRETVTFFDNKGEVLHAHSVAIELARSGKVRTLSYSDMEILHGPSKGQKVNVTGTFLYVLDQDTFYEANSLLIGEGAGPPSLGVWRRVRAK